MSNTTKIPAGYRITCVSYEGDRSNYKTIINEGLSKEETDFIALLGRILKMNGTGLENVYDPSDRDLEKAFNVLLPIFEMNSNLFNKQFINNIRADGSGMIVYINEKLLGVSEYYMRSLESIKIEYVPHDIIMTNVTYEFSFD